MKNYKKEINDFLKQYETNLKECLEAVCYGDIWQLTDAVFQLFDISLELITREGDSWIEGRYFSKKIGFEITIDHEVLFSENEDDFINEMILLKEKAEALESILMNKTDIELMLKIIDNYKDDAFYMAVEDNNSLIGLEEIEALESKLKGLK